MISLAQPTLLLGLISLLPTALPALQTAGDSADLSYQSPSERTVAVTIQEIQTGHLQKSSHCPVRGGVLIEDERYEFETKGLTSNQIEVHFEDAYGAVNDEGQLLSLAREFTFLEAAASAYSGEEGNMEFSRPVLATPLLGETVEFLWDEKAQAYGAAFASEGEREETDLDEALLASQRVDATGAWFLPPEDSSAVEIGESWDAGVEAWHRMIDIGGDFWITTEDERPSTEEAVQARKESRAGERSGGDGTVICTYKGLRQVDGQSLAVIEVVIDFKNETTSTEAWETEASKDGTVAADEWRIQIDQQLHWSGRGECLWDLTAHQPARMDFDMELESQVDTRAVPASDPQADGDAWRETWLITTGIAIVFSPGS